MEWPRKTGTVFLLILSVLLILLPVAEAAVPRQIAISGLRTNTSGGAEKNFFHSNVNFTIFDSQTGGRMLDTRERNVSTNTNGYWFINYSTTGFDTEVDLWLSINNTSPRIFLGPEPYSSQYLRKNESNSINSSFTLQGTANLRGFQSTSLVNATHVNASALGYAAIPVTATGVNLFSNLLSAANTFSGENTFSARQIFGNITLQQNLTHSIGGILINQTGGINASAIGFGTLPGGIGAVTTSIENTFSARQIFGNITLQQNLTHSIGGILINQTGGINASAVGFGSVPVGVLDLLLSTAQTWTATQTFSARQIFSNITLQQNLTHSIGGILINQTGGINASAVGFGSIPQGVLDSARTWTTAQTFTAVNLFSAGARFGNSLNVSGDVNVTFASGTGTFHVLAADGSRLLGIEDTPNTIHSIFDFNLTNGGRQDAFSVKNVLVEVFKISTVGSGIVTIGGTLNVTNVTHQTSGLLVNNAGSINASAIGFGTLPNAIIPIHNSTGAGAGDAVTSAARGGTRINFGYVSRFPDPSFWVLVNLSIGYTCTDCYAVFASQMNGSGASGATTPIFEIKRINASMFNISTSIPSANASWVAVGF